MLRKLFPEEAYRICEGTPGKYMYQDPGVYDLSNERSINELGVTCEYSGQSAFENKLIGYRPAEGSDCQGCLHTLLPAREWRFEVKSATRTAESSIDRNMLSKL